MNKDELAARLLATFLGELEEQVRTMNADLLALERQPTDAERLKSVFRVAHTLKGAARAAGVPLIEETCHALETLLAEARDGTIALASGEFALLYSAADALVDAGQRISAGRGLADAPLAAVRETLRGAAARKGAVPATAPAAPVSTPAAERGDGGVRVRAEQLDALVASAGQLMVTSGRVAARPAELEALHDFAASWASQWRRTGRRVRLALERSGAPTSLAQSLGTVDEGITRLVRDTGRLATSAAEDTRALVQVADGLGERAQRLRMRPFADACEPLPRVVRDVAAAGGKEAQLRVAGGDVEADRTVLDGLREALVQLVRNAVDHGIEPPAVRERAGKPRNGTVTVAAELKGNRIAVTVADDGMGLSVPAIREQLERRGLSVPDNEGALVRSLLEVGFSTRPEVTAISGRGVGLDIVRAAVDRVGGAVDVTWQAGHGTTFALRCPPTLAVIRALLVAVGPHVVGIPTSHVERVARIRPDEIKHAEGRDVIASAGGPVPLVALARLLPPLVEKPVSGPAPVVILTAGARRLAVVVDELLAERRVVIRPLESEQKRLRSLTGVAILESGQVALVLNPAVIVAAGLQPAAGRGVTVAEAKPAGPAKHRILVVDDSITTRTLEQSILEAAGYDVLTAVDGADGWRLLQERGCDLVVADIEMPRMNGFALCEAIRASKRFNELPIVLVTALETPEHRARGLAVRADAYIGKSSFDQQGLLDTIRELLG